MDQAEYERRKRELDQQEAAAVELLHTAFGTQRYALDLVWMASPENRGRAVLPYEPFPALAPPSPAPAPPPKTPAAPQPRRRWRPGELRAAVEAALEKVPQEFDRNHLVAALGADPERGSLYRVVEDLRLEGVLAILNNGRGRTASLYRKLK